MWDGWPWSRAAPVDLTVAWWSIWNWDDWKVSNSACWEPDSPLTTTTSSPTPLGFIIVVKNISIYLIASSLLQTVLEEKFWPSYFFLISTSNSSSKFIDFCLLHISLNHLLCPSLNVNNCRNLLIIWACYSFFGTPCPRPILAHYLPWLDLVLCPPCGSGWGCAGKRVALGRREVRLCISIPCSVSWPHFFCSDFYQTLINSYALCPFRLRGTNGLLFLFASWFCSFQCKRFFFNISFRQSLLSKLPLFLQNTEWSTISSHSLCPLENFSISQAEHSFNWKFTSIMPVIKTLQRLLWLLRTERSNSNVAHSLYALGPACVPSVPSFHSLGSSLIALFQSLEFSTWSLALSVFLNYLLSSQLLLSFLAPPIPNLKIYIKCFLLWGSYSWNFISFLPQGFNSPVNML